MHCNFITPPDIVESILVIDATEEQIKNCAEVCRSSNKPYDVYFYHADMQEKEWLERVVHKADVVIQHEDSTVPILISTKFGHNSSLKEPSEYFNK
jgi:hypothetical protein